MSVASLNFLLFVLVTVIVFYICFAPHSAGRAILPVVTIFHAPPGHNDSLTQYLIIHTFRSGKIARNRICGISCWHDAAFPARCHIKNGQGNLLRPLAALPLILSVSAPF